MKKISIIIPIYNSEKHLDECIKSIHEQTYKNIELILVNDGSTDNSKKICEKWAKIDHRIKLFEQDNSGAASARNCGIKNSTGDIITFCDSDDYYVRDDCIENMIFEFDKYNTDLVRFRCEKETKKGIVITENFNEYNNQIIINEEYDKLYCNLLYEKNRISCYTPLLLIKRNLISEFDESLTLMEDMDYYFKLLEKSKNIYFSNLITYRYRFNEMSVTKNHENSINNVKSMSDAIEKILIIIKDRKINIKKLYTKHLIMSFNYFHKIDNINNYKERINNIIKYKNYNKIINSSSIKYIPFKNIIEYILIKNRLISAYCNYIYIIKKIKNKVMS